jgi:hypothetical protein
MTRRKVAVAAAVGVGALLVFACSESPKLVGEGAACAVTTDCDRGLVCVPQQGGKRTCTGDLTSIAKTPPQPAPADAGRDAPPDGTPDGVSDSPTDSPPPPEDSQPPPVDSASE